MKLKTAPLMLSLLMATALPAGAQTLATVNGKSIPSSEADMMAKAIVAQGQKDSPELRQKIKDELINREILVEEANRLGLNNTPEFKNQMETLRKSLMVGALVSDFVKKNPVSDVEIKSTYDTVKAQTSDKEYRVRHILVDKEDDAKAIISKLKGGTKFEDLAKQSKDTASAQKGGDLDWIAPNAVVKPFSDAMLALQKGQFSETPAKTQFGYHVIRIDDVRAAKIQTLEEAKPQISKALQQQKLEKYQQDLRAKAKIQ